MYSSPVLFGFRRNFWRHWLPLLLWITLITLLSHQPKADLAAAQPSALLARSQLAPPLTLDWDTLIGKLAHFTVYLVLAWLLWRLIRNSAATFWLAAAFACLDEWHQLFIPGRSGRLFDVFVDCLGVVMLLLLIQFRRKRDCRVCLVNSR